MNSSEIETPVAFNPETDYRWLAEWWNAENPEEPRLASEYEHYDGMREPQYLFERWTSPGRWMASFGHNSWAQKEGRYVLDIEMAPEMGRDVYDRIVDWGLAKAIEAKGTEVMMWGRNDRPRSEWLVKRGFDIIETIPVTLLEMANFDPNSVPNRRTELEEEGIRFCTFADLDAEGVDWMPLLYESSWEISKDIPAAYEPTKPTYEEFRRRITSSKEHQLDRMWAAMDGNVVAGYSRLFPSQADPSRWRTGMSGVIRSHRRRGIVTVLKVMGATEAKRQGAVTIQTENNDVNPMLQVNLRMGYREAYQYLLLEKKI